MSNHRRNPVPPDGHKQEPRNSRGPDDAGDDSDFEHEPNKKISEGSGAPQGRGVGAPQVLSDLLESPRSLRPRSKLAVMEYPPVFDTGEDDDDEIPAKPQKPQVKKVSLKKSSDPAALKPQLKVKEKDGRVATAVPQQASSSLSSSSRDHAVERPGLVSRKSSSEAMASTAVGLDHGEGLSSGRSGESTSGYATNLSPVIVPTTITTNLRPVVQSTKTVAAVVPSLGGTEHGVEKSVHARFQEKVQGFARVTDAPSAQARKSSVEELIPADDFLDEDGERPLSPVFNRRKPLSQRSLSSQEKKAEEENPELKKAKSDPQAFRQSRIDSWDTAVAPTATEKTSGPPHGPLQKSKQGKPQTIQPKIRLIDNTLTVEKRELCPVCSKDITRMDRDAHVNKCLDEGKKPDFSSSSMGSYKNCPVCGKHFNSTTTANFRTTHIRNCAKEHNATAAQVIECGRSGATIVDSSHGGQGAAHKEGSPGLPTAAPAKRPADRVQTTITYQILEHDPAFVTDVVPVAVTPQTGRRKRPYANFEDEEDLEMALALSSSLQDPDAERRNKRKAASHVNFEKVAPGNARRSPSGDAIEKILGTSFEEGGNSRSLVPAPPIARVDSALSRKRRIRSKAKSLWALSTRNPKDLPLGTFQNGIFLDPLQDPSVEPVDEKQYAALYSSLLGSFRVKNDQEQVRFDREKEVHYARLEEIRAEMTHALELLEFQRKKGLLESNRSEATVPRAALEGPLALEGPSTSATSVIPENLEPEPESGPEQEPEQEPESPTMLTPPQKPFAPQDSHSKPAPVVLPPADPPKPASEMLGTPPDDVIIVAERKAKFTAPLPVGKPAEIKTPPRASLPSPQSKQALASPGLPLTQAFSPLGKWSPGGGRTTQDLPATQEYESQDMLRRAPKTVADKPAPAPAHTLSAAVASTLSSSLSSVTASLDADETQLNSPAKKRLAARRNLRDKSESASSTGTGFGPRADDSDSFSLNSDFAYDFSQNYYHGGSLGFSRVVDTQIVEQEPKYSSRLVLKESESPLSSLTSVEIPIRMEVADYEKSRGKRPPTEKEDRNRRDWGEEPHAHGEFSQFIDSFTQDNLDRITDTLEENTLVMDERKISHNRIEEMTQAVEDPNSSQENAAIMRRVDLLLNGGNNSAAPLAHGARHDPDDSPLSSPLESPPFRVDRSTGQEKMKASNHSATIEILDSPEKPKTPVRERPVLQTAGAPQDNLSPSIAQKKLMRASKYGLKEIDRKTLSAKLKRIYDREKDANSDDDDFEQPLTQGTSAASKGKKTVPKSIPSTSLWRASVSDSERPPRGDSDGESDDFGGDETAPQHHPRSSSQPVVSPRKRVYISLDSDPEDHLSSHSSDESGGETGASDGSIETRLLEYIKGNQELYLHILQYKPVNILTLHDELRQKGIKCSQKTLGTFLDFQGCTYIAPKTEKEKEKQRLKSQSRQSYYKRKKKT